ncbi:MAG: hypothetical protein HC912_06965 [Saprospiraceae bacterium]|nr:hypothetical protein [Saprospiraceae bacterium]
MRQRIITVPKDKIAEKALDYNESVGSQLIELSVTEEDFQFMFQCGIIELVNREGEANIDDFEDDVITGKERLNRVITALRSIADSSVNNELIINVIRLFDEAKNRDTGIYFYF